MCDFPLEVERGQPLEFDIWLQPASADFNGTVKVYMERNAKVKYDPEVVELKRGERRRIKATIVKSDSGLAIINAYSENFEEWTPVDITINTGFIARLKSDLNEPVQSRTMRSMALSLVDQDGNPVRLDAPLHLWLTGSKVALLSKDPVQWTEVIHLPLEAGTSKLTAIEIKPTAWTTDTGIVSVVLKTPQGKQVYDETLYVTILPPWYVPMFMAMLGGLVCTLFLFFKANFGNARRKAIKSLPTKITVNAVTGLVTGLVAYFLAAWNVLGIKVDTTSLKGFVILGFLFSYVGIDVVLRATTTKKAS